MFKNAYEDSSFADAYSKLEFPDTYYLAYRDIPELISTYATGKRALDFGCGTGRSTRFLRNLDFDVTGIDISREMLKIAEDQDRSGDYRFVKDGEYHDFEDNTFDLILSAFTFDNIPTEEKKLKILTDLKRILADEGIIINLVSSPEMYFYEWASFSTKDFPENKNARCGDVVKIINTSIADSRPVDDIIWPDKNYRDLYSKIGLEVVAMHSPLGKEDEPYNWVNETKVAPWVVYVLKRIKD